MAFTRKMLKALGIEDEKIEQIIEAHTEVTDALKQQAEDYKANAAKYESTAAELEELKKGGENWQERYDNEHSAFEEYKHTVESEKLKNGKINAYKAILKEAGISDKRYDSIIKVTDLDPVELDENGAVKDHDKYVEAVKNEWADFVVQQSTKGAEVSNPPASAGTGSLTVDEIKAIKDPVERRAAIARNLNLFK